MQNKITTLERSEGKSMLKGITKMYTDAGYKVAIVSVVVQIQITNSIG